MGFAGGGCCLGLRPFLVAGLRTADHLSLFALTESPPALHTQKPLRPSLPSSSLTAFLLPQAWGLEVVLLPSYSMEEGFSPLH